jgi:RND family efflux transporter MFP subunit
MAFRTKLLFVGLVLMAGGCNGEAPKEPEIRPVRTVVLNRRPIEDDRSAVGKIKPRYESDLSFRISGKLISRAVDVGVPVSKGDVLARLGSTDSDNRLKSAESDIVASQAVLTEAQATEARLKQLLSSGTTTQANYDGALKNLRSAAAKLDAAQEAMNLARDQLSYSNLPADFDGVVTAVGADRGMAAQRT